ncbi:MULTISPECIES: hypothetical protein [unclassified Mesobacillus]|uniref:hypothetical protein n=1 Tax=unclassified Mesobacillus TaxID=2675270 RepID=UPI002041760D|nr:MULTISPECIES: hypothetical protein [unclassified Mesobacillus]MCM3124313.1 hypothetical protein [Mesobacillus sp. MER 33]MCM3234977.1 hypothetical protein [Mesobacillus sp. MER 48]
MRKNKEKATYNENFSEVPNKEVLEISETGYGLESVAEGADFAEGDQKNSPNCGGL